MANTRSAVEAFETLRGLRLVTHHDWLVRAVKEEPGALLGLTCGSAPEGRERVPGTSFNVKWMPRGETAEAADFITGPRFGA